MKQEHRQFQLRKGKQNIFRTATDAYASFFTTFFFGLLSVLTKYPSYFVEVFMKKSFGIRYFSLSLSFIMTLFTFWIYGMLPKMVQSEIGHSWKIFILVFLAMSIRHRLEMKKFGSTYDFDRFSRSDGERLPFLYELYGKEYFGITINQYILHVFIEPIIPIVTGVVLSIIPFTRSAGILILFSAICFAIRNFLKAHGARDNVLDEIDEQLIKKWKHDVIVEERPKHETGGLSLPIDMPKSRDLREDISKSLDEPKSLDIWNSRSDLDSA